MKCTSFLIVPLLAFAAGVSARQWQAPHEVVLKAPSGGASIVLGFAEDMQPRIELRDKQGVLRGVLEVAEYEESHGPSLAFYGEGGEDELLMRLEQQSEHRRHHGPWTSLDMMVDGAAEKLLPGIRLGTRGNQHDGKGPHLWIGDAAQAYFAVEQSSPKAESLQVMYSVVKDVYRMLFSGGSIRVEGPRGGFALEVPTSGEPEVVVRDGQGGEKRHALIQR